MKGAFKAVALIALAAWATGLLSGAVAARAWLAARSEEPRADTVTVVRTDTLLVAEPRPMASMAIDPLLVRLPAHHFRGSAKMAGDTATGHIADAGKMAADSAWVEVPMETKTYTDSATYRAVVSGAWANLDTIEVWPRMVTRTVTREVAAKQRRWSVGPSIGVAVTSKGLQPCVGLTLTYSLVAW